MKNKYKTLSIVLFFASSIITVCLIIVTMMDYRNYLQHPEYSAPFSVMLLTNIALYGIPIVTGFIMAFIFKKKT